MATFISTIKFTEKGIQKIHESTKRAAAFKAAAKK
ncbi:MAG: GYD family protein, partial [Planctomycetia bacterium]|nr:GYD family protein [Planctomycetia bacterium]